MTAEVCLMNRMGVALAADSAVTLVGDDSPKIYNSADKLFLLSEESPVAIMVYGSAALTLVPWETLVKLYRAQKVGAKPLASVDAYAKDFVAFLQHRMMGRFPEVQQATVKAHVRAAFSEIKADIQRRTTEVIERQGKIPEPKMRALLYGWLNEALDALRRKIEKLPTLKPEISRKLLARRCSAAISKAWVEHLGAAPTTPALLRKATSVVIEALRRDAKLADSGVIVAGFGADEIFPSMVSLHVYDIVADRIRMTWEPAKGIDASNSGWVMSFAQQEMVRLFMEGVDPTLDGFVRAVVEKLYRSLPEEFAKCIGVQLDTEQRRGLDALVSAMLPKMWQGLLTYRQEHFTSPVTEIVSHLPKDELAAMAEALVNLTSFRRRVTRDAATVGGPIDVAVITKGDGFVWIRRKHYFDPALNPRYIARHYR